MAENNNSKVYLVGGGIASLASAVFLIRDAHVPGANIHILEQDGICGGALDGRGDGERGFLARGGRMHEANFVCCWDLLSSIPSRGNPVKSVAQETFEFNEKYVSNSRSRLLKDAEVLNVSSYGLSWKDKWHIAALTLAPEALLGDRRIQDWFSPEFFETKFWKIWESMFAFQQWSSVAVMRRYCLRFMHLFPGLHRLGGIYRTAYNQYDSVIVPLEHWLKEKGVRFELNTRVEDIDFNCTHAAKAATAIHCLENGIKKTLPLGENDFVFITNGSIVEGSDVGSIKRPAALKTKESSGSWRLWDKIAKKDPAFGNPGAFSDRISLQKWESFTITVSDPALFRHLAEKYGYIPGVSGLMTITDSNWLLSMVAPAQPHFVNQPAEAQVVWGYGLHPDNTGNFIKKTMQECSGEEILSELFHHLKIAEKMAPIVEARKINCLPCMMPFIDSLFMPCLPGARPAVVPKGARNFAFIGQFAEVPDDCVFTVEYSARTAMTAVYTLFKTGKRILPVYIGGRKLKSLYNACVAINR